ncbi:methyltransferase domain protein [Synechococcus sp. A18-40]|nr:methyltransferase domain protein [Synechococcus sp. A18-40]
MAFNQRTLLRTIFRTSHRILLDRIIKSFYPLIRGNVLVLGAGQESYDELSFFATSIILSDVDSSNQNISKVVDAHSIAYPASSFESVLAVEVLEHLQHPEKAASEIYRVLCADGIAVLSVPFMFHIHADPCDYNRFTENGLKQLFVEFSFVEVIPYGSRIHVISDIISTSSKSFALLRVFNWLLTLPLFSSSSIDCPSGYIVVLKR